MTLQRLALSRATLDRAAHRRISDDLVEGLLSEPTTAVLLLDGDRAPVLDGPVKLALVDPATAIALRARGPASAEQEVAAFLGEDADGRPYLMLARLRPPRRPGAVAGAVAVAVGGNGAARSDGPSAPDLAVPDPSVPDLPAPDSAGWRDLRAVGHLLDDTEAGILTCAVAVSNWHGGHLRCACCGAATEPIQAGWARACPSCGTEHYPRTDPAVIMAVVDRADRILLGRQAHWSDKRFSTLAGFVEPGESLEAAVRREVAEESGVLVGQVDYRGSQPWPFPSSLMLGFRATALSTRITVDGAELAQARWWTREELALDLATGELALPPPVSIARRLVEDWYGGPLGDGGDAWH